MNGDVYSGPTKDKFATIDNEGNLYSGDGKSLNIHLEVVNGGGRIGNEVHSHAVARIKALATGLAIDGSSPATES